MPTLCSDDEAIIVDPPSDGAGDGDEDGPSRWVVVATFWQPTEAHLARLKLESEEIDCQLFNENVIATDPLLAPAVGGIKLLVADFEIVKARTLLHRPLCASADVTPFAFGCCPQCGSSNIERPVAQAQTLWAALVALMILGPFAPAGLIFYLVMWRPFRCKDCSNVFRRRDGRQGFPIVENPAPATER